jgi:hypothetical protein
MDSLFWILAGVVVGCVIGIILLWRLEVQAERRADSRQIEAEVSARLKIFDPRAVVEEIDTRPIPATGQPAPRQAPPALETATLPGPAETAPPQSEQQNIPVEERSAADVPVKTSALALLEALMRATPAASSNGATAAEQAGPANGKADPPMPPEVSPTTPERAWLRAAQLGRERRYLEQVIEEQQARLDQISQGALPGETEETAAIGLLQSELAQQRARLQEIILLEERYRKMAVPSLEQLAQDYKKAAAPNTPRAFGVRRHSLARIEPSGQNPPTPPAQAPTEPST